MEDLVYPHKLHSSDRKCASLLEVLCILRRHTCANEHSRRVHWGWQWRLTSLLKNAWKPSRDTSVSLECWFNGGLSLSTQVTLKWQEMCIPPGSPVHTQETHMCISGDTHVHIRRHTCAYSGDTHVNRSARAYGGHNNLPFPETRQSSFYQSHPYASGRSWTAAQCPAGWPNRGSTPASAAALCPPSSGPGSEVKGQSQKVQRIEDELTKQ